MHHHTGDHIDEHLALFLGKRAHHAEIDPLDIMIGKGQFFLLGGFLFALCTLFIFLRFDFFRFGLRCARAWFSDEDIARMRVGMIEAVNEDLRSEVVRDKGGDALALIIIERSEEFRVAYLFARGKVFSEDRFTGEFTIAFRAHDRFAVGIVFPEAFQIVRLVGEVELDFRGVLEFHDHALDVDPARILFDELVKDLLDQGKVPCDRVHHTGTADFDRHNSAVEQFRSMHLPDGGRSQGLVVKRSEQFVHRFAQILLDLRIYGLKIHWSHIGAQFHERVAVIRGDVLGLLGGDLADLDESRSQILQDAYDDLRRDAVFVIVLSDDRKDLFEPSVGIRLGFFRVFPLFDQCRDKSSHVCRTSKAFSYVVQIKIKIIIFFSGD